jgi:hypothetical protein
VDYEASMSSLLQFCIVATHLCRVTEAKCKTGKLLSSSALMVIERRAEESPAMRGKRFQVGDRAAKQTEYIRLSLFVFGLLHHASSYSAINQFDCHQPAQVFEWLAIFIVIETNAI